MVVRGVLDRRASRWLGGTDRGCESVMAISLSVVLLLAIVLVVLIRGGSLKGGPAVVAILFGFFLASTGMADDIQRFLDSITQTIGAIKF